MFHFQRKLRGAGNVETADAINPLIREEEGRKI